MWQTPLHRVCLNAQRDTHGATVSEVEELIVWLVRVAIPFSQVGFILFLVLISVWQNHLPRVCLNTQRGIHGAIMIDVELIVWQVKSWLSR